MTTGRNNAPCTTRFAMRTRGAGLLKAAQESAYDFLSQDVRTNWHPIVEVELYLEMFLSSEDYQGSCNISKLESNRTAISSIYAVIAKLPLQTVEKSLTVPGQIKPLGMSDSEYIRAKIDFYGSPSSLCYAAHPDLPM